MGTPALIAIIICAAAVLVAITALGLILPAWLYYRGTSRASPIPDILARIAQPAAKIAGPTAKCPYAGLKCPFCNKLSKWILAADESVWTCTSCENVLAGPKPRIHA